MEYLEIPPAPPLDAIVHCFWFLRGDLEGASQPVVPDGRLEIVLHLAEPFAQVDASDIARPQRETLVSGQLTSAIRLAARGPADIVGIRFRTVAGSAVLRLPPSELTDRIEPLADIAPVLAGALLDAAASTGDPGRRATALGAALARFIARSPATDVVAAVRALDSPHPPRLTVLARELGLSTRSLERHVLAATGLPPRTLQRVMRFRRAFRMIDRAPPGRMAEAAASAGYYDQSHLIRDFNAFAGAPPSTFFEAEADLARAMSGGEGG
jgi:methylphosphotriester-DNA--protein-cysteine methyltransferase